MKKSMLFTRIVSTVFLTVFSLSTGVLAKCQPVTFRSAEESELYAAYLNEQSSELSDSAAAQAAQFVHDFIEEFRAIPTSKTLAVHNEAGCKEHKVGNLDGESLLLLAKTYEYFLFIANKRSITVFGINALDGLKACYINFKPLLKSATEQERVVRMTILGEIFTIVIKRLIDKKLLMYEGSKEVEITDDMAKELEVIQELKENRCTARKLFSPAHRIVETLINFAPLMLMAILQQTLAASLGKNSAAIMCAIGPVSALANTFLLGQVSVVRLLAKYNPVTMVINLIMSLIRTGSHQVVEEATEGKSTTHLEKVSKAVSGLAVCFLVWRHGSKTSEMIAKGAGAIRGMWQRFHGAHVA